MIKLKIIFGIFAVICISVNAIQAQGGKDKRSAFVQTVDILIEQVEIQSQDRDTLLKKLRELAAQLKAAQTANLDNRILIARDSAVERQALITAENLTDNPKRAVIKTNLVEYLHSVVEKDQQLYEDYLKQKSEVGFQLEKQIAKIRAEQTQLAMIRRDLEKIKFYPLKKERARFFLSSISKTLGGIGKLSP